MQKEIDAPVEQRDRAMDRADGLAYELQKALSLVDYCMVRYKELNNEK